MWQNNCNILPQAGTQGFAVYVYDANNTTYAYIHTNSYTYCKCTTPHIHTYNQLIYIYAQHEYLHTYNTTFLNLFFWYSQCTFHNKLQIRLIQFILFVHSSNFIVKKNIKRNNNFQSKWNWADKKIKDW